MLASLNVAEGSKSSRTPAQAAASRANAHHSTGPRTRLGKLRIRHNGVKHGLYAATAPMIGERRRDYARLRDALVAELQPASALEEMLVQRAASLLWRLGRVPAAENALFESFALEAAQALRPAADEARDPLPEEEGEEVQVDLLWGLAFRAGLSDSPVNRIARWERSLQLQLRDVTRELAQRQAARRQAAADAAAASARQVSDEDKAYAQLDQRIALRNNAFTRAELEDEVIRQRTLLDQYMGRPPSYAPLHAAGDALRRRAEDVYLNRFLGHAPGTVVAEEWEPDLDEADYIYDLVAETLAGRNNEPLSNEVTR